MVQRVLSRHNCAPRLSISRLTELINRTRRPFGSHASHALICVLVFHFPLCVLRTLSSRLLFNSKFLLVNDCGGVVLITFSQLILMYLLIIISIAHRIVTCPYKRSAHFLHYALCTLNLSQFFLLQLTHRGFLVVFLFLFIIIFIFFILVLLVWLPLFLG